MLITACQKLCHNRNTSSRPTTPNHYRPYPSYVPSPTNGYSVNPAPSSPGLHHSPGIGLTPNYRHPNNPDEFKTRYTGTMNSSSGSAGSGSEAGKFAVPAAIPDNNKENKELPTPSSTPTSSRKNRRRSNLFTPSKKGGNPENPDKSGNGGNNQQMGSGRSIPIRQGILYKKSNKSFSKDWKKKYVTLCDDGRMTYHPSLHDYMDNVHGKEISLQYVTVKVPGQKPRGSRTIPSTVPPTTSNSENNNFKVTHHHHQAGSNNTKGEKVMLTGYEMLRDPSMNEEDNALEKSSSSTAAETPNVKKRHRRMKSNGVKTNSDHPEEVDAYEFHIVSLDNKQWHFEASNAEERDDWVGAIEQQILNSLQSSKSAKNPNSAIDLKTIKMIKSEISGNSRCVDCDSPSKF